MSEQWSEAYRLARHRGADEALEWLTEHLPDAVCQRCNKRGLSRGESFMRTCTDCRGREQLRHNENRMRNGMAPLYCDCRHLDDDEFHSQGFAFRFDPKWPGDRTRGVAIEIEAGEGRPPRRKLCGTWERYLRNQPQQLPHHGKMGLVD
jgi:hypothetical protein